MPFFPYVCAVCEHEETVLLKISQLTEVGELTQVPLFGKTNLVCPKCSSENWRRRSNLKTFGFKMNLRRTSIY